MEPPEITAAALQYHGKSKGPTEKEHKVELEVVILDSNGIIDPRNYVLQNISGHLISKGSDFLTYRIRFLGPNFPELTEARMVKICPNDTVSRRFDGRAECGFIVQPYKGDDDDSVTNGFYSDSGCTIVFTKIQGTAVTKEIYFSIEDVNLTETGVPIWVVSADTSALLAGKEELKGRWKSLKPIHPDPAVDPGVPIEFRPQRTPGWYWYRYKCTRYDLFKGKLSASRWFSFLGGYGKKSFTSDEEFKSKGIMRYGRMAEPHLVIAVLLANPSYEIYECGTYPHPTIPDICASPDAIIHDKTRSFDSLPNWYRELIKKDGNVDPTKIDWTKGVLEAKNMLFLDKDKKGPIFKWDHMCQLYGEMICTGTWWGEVYRHCKETGECRMFRVYRKPDFSDRIINCIVRMRNEMMGGTPYHIAVDHQSNHEIIESFKVQTKYYNDTSAPPPKFRHIPWPSEAISQFEELVKSVDFVAYSLNGGSGDKIAQMNSRNGAPKREEVQTKRKKTTRGGGDDINGALSRETEHTRVLVKNCVSMSKDNQERWSDIQSTNKEIGRCISNGHWYELVDTQILKTQILRYVELEKQIGMEQLKNELDKSSKKRKKQISDIDDDDDNNDDCD